MLSSSQVRVELESAVNNAIELVSYKLTDPTCEEDGS